jgi:hypothetical protein
MSRVFWSIVQIGVIVFFCWADHASAIEYGGPPMPGLAVAMGIMAAWMLTAGLTTLWGKLVRYFRRLQHQVDNRRTARVSR